MDQTCKKTPLSYPSERGQDRGCCSLLPHEAPSITQETNLKFRRVFLENFEIARRFPHDGDRHGNVPVPNANVLLGIGVQVDAHAPTGIADNGAAEATDIAALEETALDFRSEDVLELVHAAHGETLVQGVDAAAPARFPVRGQEEGGLIDPVRVPLLGKVLVQLCPGLAGDADKSGQDIDLVEQAVGGARLDHVLPADESGHAHAAFPAGALAAAPRAAAVRWTFLLRTVIRSQNDDGVVELAGFLQDCHQS